MLFMQYLAENVRVIAINTKMTTGKQYDFLNRLTQIVSAPGGSGGDASGANQ